MPAPLSNDLHKRMLKTMTADLLSININCDNFYQWTIQSLLPKLPKNSVIVLDNTTFHKRLDMRETLENAGHIVCFLSAYSPELNSIEKKWAQLKAWKKKRSCSLNALFKIESFYLRWAIIKDRILFLFSQSIGALVYDRWIMEQGGTISALKQNNFSMKGVHFVSTQIFSL